jgi:hypothetical protein
MAAVPESDLPDNLRGKAVPAEDMPSAAPSEPPGEIPGAGPFVAPAPSRQRAGEPSIPQKMAMYAAAVPAGGLAAGALRYGARGTQFAPYTERAVEALVPKTLGQLTGATTFAGLSAVPAEYSRRAAERAGAGPVGQMAAETAGASAALVPAVAAQRAYTNLSRRIGTAMSSEPRELAERLRQQTLARASQEVEAARAAETRPLRELTSIQSAQEQLAGRLGKAQARQTAREKAAQEALDKLSTQQQVLPEDLGGVIQNIGQSNIKSLAAKRTQEAITKVKDPAFETARSRELQGDFISSNPQSAQAFNSVVAELRTQINRTPEPYRSTLQKRFESIMGERVAVAGKEASRERSMARLQGRAPQLETTKPMTLDQAEFLRRMLSDRQTAEVEGFAALDVGRMNDLAKRLRQAMVDYEPRVGEYLVKYREMSAPIERATAGRGAALTEAELLGAEGTALFSADKTAATKYYLDGSQERAQRLLDLVGGKTPQVVGSIRGYLRTSMQGMNAKQAQDFIAKNEGMLRVFPELKPQMEQIARTRGVAETAPVAAAQKAEAAGKRLTAQEKRATTAREATTEQRRKYEGMQQNILNAQPGREVQAAEMFADTLFKDKKIDAADYGNLLEQIRNVQRSAANQAEAKQKLQTLFVRLGWGLGGVGAAGTVGYIVR